MSNPYEMRRTCADFRRSQPLNRRSFLRAGVMGASGLTLSGLLQAEASGAIKASQQNSVIILWMRGGTESH